MIRTVLIDDEKIVIEGLRRLIPWNDYGFKLIQCCTDGVEAQKKILQLKPDFVITDIRMPGMDGLTMIEKVKKELPNTVFAVISGFTEFEYARKAICLGVSDYIEKPITINKMTELLQRVGDLCRQEKIEQEKFRQAENYTEALVKNAILEIACAGESFENSVAKLDEPVRQELSNIRQICLITGTAQKYKAEDDAVIDRAFYKHTGTHHLACYIIKHGEQFVAAIFNRSEPLKKADFTAVVKSAVDSCGRRRVEVTAGIGGVFDSPEQIRRSYLESLKALRYAQFKSISGICEYNCANYDRSAITLHKVDLQNIMDCLRGGRKEEMLKKLQQYLLCLNESDLPPEICSQECLKLVYRAMDEVKRMGKSCRLDSTDGLLPHEQVDRCLSSEELLQWTTQMFKSIAKQIDDEACQEDKPILMAKNYIIHNFNKEISLNEIAAYVGLSPAYMSVLFKKKTGMQYVKYLTHVRMEFACELLKQGYKVVQVSEKCGFSNYRYFCETFKKAVGMTPNDFKQK